MCSLNLTDFRRFSEYWLIFWELESIFAVAYESSFFSVDANFRAVILGENYMCTVISSMNSKNLQHFTQTPTFDSSFAWGLKSLCLTDSKGDHRCFCLWPPRYSLSLIYSYELAGWYLFGHASCCLRTYLSGYWKLSFLIIITMLWE